MTQNLDLTGLTPKQIEQIYAIIEAFRTTNKYQNPLTEEQQSQLAPNPLFFESEILQPFNRSMLYGKQT
ncbi:hypothetical protein QUB70_03865 [Microcoleus sp. A003_D6]|uniref:hypothetical protein n=1 Tax=Microcoleus sp. A003_D6 TaxID=3055266 RepID=UPI002FD40D86